MIHSVGILYDQMTDTVELQVLRDLMVLKGTWPDVWVNDPANQMDEQLLDQIGVSKTKDQPVIVISYKVGPNFVNINPGRTVVERDLSPEDGTQHLDSEPRPGFYLRPQGRDGANLTDLYLNRSHPRGTGIVDPLVVYLWS